jgi:glycosyltransferase involved in cell wall biosynthesis
VATLSAVIPATDGRPTLAQALRAVEIARAAPEEVIVVDRPAGLGPAAARNLGARRAAGDVIVFIDADVEVHADAFERIRAAFDDDAELAAVFGSYDDDPGGDGLVSDFRNLLHHHVHQQGAGPAATFWAGLGAIRREVLLELGGFDEGRYPRPSIEDVELGARLAREGGRILLDPAIQGRHLKTWTLQGMVETDVLARGVPWLRMMLEDRSHSTVLNLGWRHRIGAGAAVALLAALFRRNFQLAAVLVVLLLAIDSDFYGLLWRRRGAKLLAAGIPLHIVHRLASVAAVPVALIAHLAYLFGTSSRRA